ncbi:MAG: TIR domain-containing protein [Burkholderiales bacterium]
MADIFLSYSTADRARIRPLVDALQASGWSVWWDRRIPAGRTYAEVIEAAIRDARCIVVVWTAKSIESEWVREEADRGKKRKRLVPVRMDDVEPPIGFGQIQAADLIGWDGDRAAQGYRQLADDLANILGAPAKAEGAPTRVQAPAPMAVEADVAAASVPEAHERVLRQRAGVHEILPQSARAQPLWRKLALVFVLLAAIGSAGSWYVWRQHQAERQEAKAARERQQIEALKAREEQAARLDRERRLAEEATQEQRRIEALKTREEQQARLAEEKRLAEEAAREKQRVAALKAREAREARLAEEKRLAEEAARHTTPHGIGGIEQQRGLAAEIGWPDRVRCFGYDPKSVRAEPGTEHDWNIMSGNFQLARADTRANADAVVRIARAHAAKCVLGLDARAPNNRQRVFVFWERGVAPTLPGEYCLRYDPRNLRIRDEGPIGWGLVDVGRDQQLHVLNNQADARVALSYAKKHSALCFIGLNSQLPKPLTYVTRYWKR